MSQKLNQEHLDAINKLQNDFSELTTKLGANTIDLEFIESQKKSIEEQKYALLSEFANLRTQEDELLNTLKTQYGEGHINIQDGTFTPIEEIK